MQRRTVLAAGAGALGLVLTGGIVVTFAILWLTLSLVGWLFRTESIIGILLCIPLGIIAAIGLLLSPIWIYAVVLLLPNFFAGVIYVFTNPESLQIATRHASDRRPSHDVEAELAIALRREAIDIMEVESLVDELPPWRAWLQRIKYRSYAAKLREASKSMKIQRDALNAATQVARDAHELEREKRNAGR